MNQVAIRGADDSSSSGGESLSSDEEYGRGNFHVILDKETDVEKIMAFKRAADGQPLPKTPRMGSQDPMPIRSLLNPVPADVEKKSVRKKKTSSQRKMKKKRSHPRRHSAMIDRPEKYDVISAMTNAPSGLTFGQLWRGDAASAEKDLDRMLGKNKLKVGVLEEDKNQGNDEQEEKCLAVASLKDHGLEAYALLDTGATPNVMSLQLAKQLGLQLQETKKVVTVANGSRSGVLGKVNCIPVLFESLQVYMDFVVLENVPFDVVIGRPTLKRLGAVLDFRTEKVCLDYHGKGAVVPMLSEYVRTRTTQEDSDSADFTSDTDEDDSAHEKLASAQELVLTIRGPNGVCWSEDDATEPNNREVVIRQELNKRVDHLPVRVQEQIEALFIKKGVVATSLRDLCPADVPFKRNFEISDETPVYHSACRMTPKHNEVVQREVESMLKAGIITPASSAWSFPVVIATKKDGKPRFCVDCRILNWKMKADRFPLPKIQEIFDELAGGYTSRR